MAIRADRDRERLRILIDSGRELMRAAEPEALVEVILESAMRLFAAEGCSLGRLDAERSELRFATMVGPARTEEFRIGVDKGIAGWVASHGEGVVCNDVSSDPRFYADVDRSSGFATRSVLCVPLWREQQVIGVLQVLNTTDPDGFQDDDREALQGFAGLVATALERAGDYEAVRDANAALQEAVGDRYRLVVGESAALREAVEVARTVAAANSTVLLLGRSGTGKEVLARAIHAWSPRADGPFVAVNCLALAPQLLESELFGHEKGAFTGAVERKKGKFELAERGTLFLDEIGELAIDLQGKLLRVLQEREFQRVGGVLDLRTDVRIVAATNQDLPAAIARGSFREDLYYRLNVVSIALPSLRERREDIPLLVRHFVTHFCREVSRPPLDVEPAAMKRLAAYDWPGNVRELSNAIERAVVLCSGDAITPRDLPPQLGVDAAGGAGDAIDPALPLSEAVEAFKRSRIRSALVQADGNQTEAARLLGMRQSNLSRMLKTLGIA